MLQGIELARAAVEKSKRAEEIVSKAQTYLYLEKMGRKDYDVRQVALRLQAKLQQYVGEPLPLETRRV